MDMRSIRKVTRKATNVVVAELGVNGVTKIVPTGTNFLAYVYAGNTKIDNCSIDPEWTIVERVKEDENP